MQEPIKGRTHPHLPPHLLVFLLTFLHHLLLRRQFGSAVVVLRTHQTQSSATLYIGLAGASRRRLAPVLRCVRALLARGCVVSYLPKLDGSRGSILASELQQFSTVLRRANARAALCQSCGYGGLPRTSVAEAAMILAPSGDQT